MSSRMLHIRGNFAVIGELWTARITCKLVKWNCSLSMIIQTLPAIDCMIIICHPLPMENPRFVTINTHEICHFDWLFGSNQYIESWKNMERTTILSLFVIALYSSFSRSGQVWGHTPELRVAAPQTGLRLAIAQADARPVMCLSLR